MEAELNTRLPQEGTSLAGESLPESDSGCPIVSGGGKISLTTSKAAPNKKCVQQVFHPSLFLTRPRSLSFGNKPDANTTLLIPDQLTPEVTDTTPSADYTSPPPWQRIPIGRQNKKRKITTSPPAEGIATANSFSQLPIDLTEDLDTVKTPCRPPPIVLYGIEDVKKLSELLETGADKTQFTYKIVNRNQLRITSSNIEVYKTLITLVRENGLIGHTFNRKDKRNYRIVIRNLHHTTPIASIIEAIEKTGNTVSGEIINSRYGPDKKPTSTFFVNLTPGPKNADVKGIKTIYNQVVQIEDPKKRKTIVQCQRCQQYGHSKNYCLRPYRCVKCAESHKTSECPKVDRNTPATCALCLGPHPANYKGCEVYREILARKTTKHAPTRNRDVPTREHLIGTNNNHHRGEFNTEKHRKTYSEVVKTSNNETEGKNPTVDPTLNTHKLEMIITKQTEKFDLLLQQMSTLLSLITSLLNKFTK